MRKEDVVWHEEDKSIVMEDADGWKLICVMNHFKGRFHYEIKTPDNYYLDYISNDIYETIERINQEKELTKSKPILRCKLNNKPCVYRNQPDTGAYENCRLCYVYEQYTMIL